MKKIIIAGAILFMFSKVFAGEYCAVPPFLVKGVKPNILIILDNSNSMDEDFYGNAVGSYSPKSKSVVAKKELIRIIEKYKDKIRAGLITYRLADDVYPYHLHNSFYFTSYNPKTYCPDPPESCVEFCQSENSAKKIECENTCKNQNPDFDAQYTLNVDEILTTYSIGSEERNRYCSLVYPKTQRYPNPVSSGDFIFYKKALPFYSPSSYGKAFCYSFDYDPYEGEPYDTYYCYKYKEGSSDDFKGYSYYWFRSKFYPTDSDYALGFLDFGKRLSWVYIGRTWYSNSSPGDGYIHVYVDDMVNNSNQETSTYSLLLEKLDPKENNEDGYMSCTNRDKNRCPYIINAGLTPSAGTFQTVIDYLTGNQTPIKYKCQKTFVIYVTDGLPSVDENGSTNTADILLPDVIEKIKALRNIDVEIDGKLYTFDIKTYVLGVALSKEAKEKLDKMAQAGGTSVNSHAYYADNPDQLREALNKIFEDIIKKVSSSSSVATLSDRSKAGAIITQALFLPEKRFGEKNISWIGNLYGYWFFNSTKIQNIREDTVQNLALDKISDSIIEFRIDETGLLNIDIYEPNSDGDKGNYLETLYSLDDINSIFNAGKRLVEKKPDERRIFTTDGKQLIVFSSVYKTDFEEFLGDKSTFPSCLGENPIDNLIRYIRGEEIAGCREKSINDFGDTWKLGDIIYSSPKIVKYPDYSIVLVGTNDGMLHAFRAGYLSRDGLSENQIVKLQNSETDTSTDKLGEELWAFIPKNALPYLRYLPDPDYCHMYFVDLTPYVFKYKNRKILIGGMRLGGACGCSGSNCINPPSDTCPLNGECVGLSSYFALDITDPENPSFMWEFTDNDLGFSFSGPGIVKKKDKAYVIFASGPTNYQGDSGQPLKLFVVDLDTGELVRKINTGINNAFGGRLFTQGLDYDGDGTTDYIALGYARKDGDMNNWKGGLIFIDVSSPFVSIWEYNTYLDNAQGPILTKVEYMKCFDRWYIYFGSGRWFYKTDNPLSGQRERLYGLPLDCSSYCRPIVSLYDATNGSQSLCLDLKNNVFRGWYVELDLGGGGYLKERSITDPTTTNRNVVIFPTTQPTSDLCGFGGRSRVWVLNCATGDALNTDYDCGSYSINNVKGTVLIQLSGGDIQEVSIKEFLDVSRKRYTDFFIGTLPEDSQTAIYPPSSSKRKGNLLLWLEK